MNAVVMQQIMELSEKLLPHERLVLISRLQSQMSSKPLTREQLLAEFEQRKASGAFENLESLHGKYANPDVDISADELTAYRREIAAEWEQDIDEPSDD